MSRGTPNKICKKAATHGSCPIRKGCVTTRWPASLLRVAGAESSLHACIRPWRIGESAKTQLQIEADRERLRQLDPDGINRRPATHDNHCYVKLEKKDLGRESPRPSGVRRKATTANCGNSMAAALDHGTSTFYVSSCTEHGAQVGRSSTRRPYAEAEGQWVEWTKAQPAR